MNLEELLADLARYGSPMLSQYDHSPQHWFCKISTRVNATGVSFDVKATGKTPAEAAKGCHANMLAAIKNINSVAEPGRALLQGA